MPAKTSVLALALAAALAAGHALAAPAPPAALTVVADDVDRFWTAYDAARATQDPAEQRERFQRLYIDPGTPGLRAFMQAKGYTAQSYVDAVRAYPRFWETARPRTARVKGLLPRLQPGLDRFRALYPALRPATVYFEIGALKSSGTTLDDKVLIGAEMATGDDGVDVSETPERLRVALTRYFAARPFDDIDVLVMHELTHTQERGERRTLLAQALYEGVADFVAERTTGRLPALPYVAYGPAHADAIRTAFARDMMASDYGAWLYSNADNPFGVRDLGYYVGYAICEGYYRRAKDKREAVRAMIELDFSDQDAVRRFVDASGYFG
ncbi:MAG: hypothetical protein IIZ63_05740 [Caulobacteraceae bacterium]|nr:hypothetical protein [Caulobacteraceae bacterium]